MFIVAEGVIMSGEYARLSGGPYDRTDGGNNASRLPDSAQLREDPEVVRAIERANAKSAKKVVTALGGVSAKDIRA